MCYDYIFYMILPEQNHSSALLPRFTSENTYLKRKERVLQLIAQETDLSQPGFASNWNVFGKCVLRNERSCFNELQLLAEENTNLIHI